LYSYNLYLLNFLMNVKKDKKVEKNLKEIDKLVKDLENNVEIIIDSNTKQSQIKSKFINVQKLIDTICIPL